MAHYLIGDVQGCDAALGRLLLHIDFSASRDRLFLLGDLVNRGPESLATLRRLRDLGDSAQCLLGNHDLHLLAVSQGLRTAGRNDTLAEVLQASDAAALLDWLRHQHLALLHEGCLMVHAGVLPSWTAQQTLDLAGEVQTHLRSPDWREFLTHLFGNEPKRWDDDLSGWDRLRVIVNALTRLRLCQSDGTMEFKHKTGLEDLPEGYWPWFAVPGRRTEGLTVAFGHWSTLGQTGRSDALALDSACVWGGCLTALKWSADPRERAYLQVPCPAQGAGQD
jgi:bis(5'-nucleosyl)-tetraphosphatase (symmetrical)